MKKLFITAISMTFLVSCGQISNTLRGSLDINNFTRNDAIRVFECAINKEESTAGRFALEAQLAINKNLSDSAWQRLVNVNRQNAFDGVNNVAKKYNCY